MLVRSRVPPTSRRVALALVVLVMIVPTVVSATVEEQRRRLPPPAECDDPIQGTWKSHAYYPGHGQWYIFTLTVARDPQDPSKLTGRVHSHYWAGGPADEEPPPCVPGGFHQTVVMPAEGTVDGFRIQFGGTSWQNEQALCGSPTRSYYPDVFSGVIDPELLEFQSVNNDGGPMVNYPTVFRRIACSNDSDAPHLVVEPPAFYPETSGCGCGVF